MDDIMSALNNALSDPETMDKVSQMLSSLGSAPSGSPEPEPPSPDLPDMTQLMQLTTVLNKSSENDPYIALIKAMRPLLRPETRPKADRAIKLLRLMAAYPIIRDSGLLEII